MSNTGPADLLRKYNLTARKSLGQHFLVNQGVLSKILAAAELQKGDLVVEVGPGLGVLTKGMAQQAGQVVAVELDQEIADILERQLLPYPNVTVIKRDILELDVKEMVVQHHKSPSGSPPCYKVVANLPYYIATAVIRHFLEAALRPKLMVVMVQREVGQNMLGRPGTISLLTLGIQVYGKPRIVARVSAGSFYPPPKVDSVVVAIDVYDKPLAKDTVKFFPVARAGFSAPRKQLSNSLAQGLGISSEEAKLLLVKAGIDGRRRPGTLSIEEWEAISNLVE